MCLLPHGGYALIPATLSTIAFLTTLFHDGYDYAKLHGKVVDILINTDGFYPFIEIGFSSFRIPTFYEEHDQWQTRYGDVCQSFSSIDAVTGESVTVWKPDSLWNFARAAHLISMIVGDTVVLNIWIVSICLPVTKYSWRLFGVAMFMASFFQLCSLIWFLNDICNVEESHYSIFYGSQTSMIALALYFGSLLLICFRYPEPIIVQMARKQIETKMNNQYDDSTADESEFDSASFTNSFASGYSGSMRRKSFLKKRIRWCSVVLVLQSRCRF